MSSAWQTSADGFAGGRGKFQSFWLTFGLEARQNAWKNAWLREGGKGKWCCFLRICCGSVTGCLSCPCCCCCLHCVSFRLLKCLTFVALRWHSGYEGVQNIGLQHLLALQFFKKRITIVGSLLFWGWEVRRKVIWIHNWASSSFHSF